MVMITKASSNPVKPGVQLGKTRYNWSQLGKKASGTLTHGSAFGFGRVGVLGIGGQFQFDVVVLVELGQRPALGPLQRVQQLLDLGRDLLQEFEKNKQKTIKHPFENSVRRPLDGITLGTGFSLLGPSKTQ